jgi:hypothetical protein
MAVLSVSLKKVGTSAFNIESETEVGWNFNNTDHESHPFICHRFFPQTKQEMINIETSTYLYQNISDKFWKAVATRCTPTYNSSCRSYVDQHVGDQVLIENTVTVHDLMKHLLFTIHRNGDRLDSRRKLLNNVQNMKYTGCVWRAQGVNVFGISDPAFGVSTFTNTGSTCSKKSRRPIEGSASMPLLMRQNTQ